MELLETLLVAMSTYSSLPMPQFEWNEKNMRYAICFFPAVGAVCGGALLLWNWFCFRLNVNPVLFASVAVCLPLLITGGIHMDGYMDTVDALASHQSRERKLEILKDSTCGAFPVKSIICPVCSDDAECKKSGNALFLHGEYAEKESLCSYDHIIRGDGSRPVLHKLDLWRFGCYRRCLLSLMVPAYGNETVWWCYG